MINFAFLVFFVFAVSSGEKKYEHGRDSYIDAYIEAHNLNKSKIKRKINLEKEGQNYGADGGYDYAPAPYPPSRPVYGPPATNYAPEPMFSIPYALASIIDKVKSKLEILTLMKILLKLVLFKKFVSFVGIICLLLFIPWLKDSKYGQDGNGEDSGDGDDAAMRKIKNGPFDDEHLNSITMYIFEAVRKFGKIDKGEVGERTKCSSVYCKVNSIAKQFADKFY